jgi:hydrogenase expression/formation protein HypE
VLDSLAAVADAAEAEVIGGDTKTIPTREPRMIVTITGIGLIRRDGPALGFASVRPGDEIVVTGAVGAHAIAVLSAREGLGFDQVVTSDVQDVGRVLGAFVAADPRLRALRDASRGGVLGVLHEIVAATGLDLEVDVAAITVQREVAMAAEMLGLDPLELANEGCFVLLIEQGQAAQVVSQLREEYGMSDAVHAGTVRAPTEPPGRLVLQTDGGRKLSLRSRRVGVPRLC